MSELSIGNTPEPTPTGHAPVLPGLTASVLAPAQGEVFADATAGLGGHAAMIARSIGPDGRVVLNDLDLDNLRRAEPAVRAVHESWADAPDRVVARHGGFVDLPAFLQQACRPVDMLLADLGFASTQVDDADRGLSFRRDGPLDMRFDRSQGTTAADLVNGLPERELADLIYAHGEERLSRRIAAKVVAARAVTPISTTGELAALVREAYPASRRSKIDPATRTFQALRIAVNDELGSLTGLLDAIEHEAQRHADARTRGDGEPGGWLRPGARVAIISFHSLEDRPVKQRFADLIARGLVERLTKKPLRGDDAEIAANPRARSAKLRAIRFPGS